MACPAELFHHHVFVDLETTGLNPQTDEVIEVGALFVEEGQVVRRISRLFRPSAPLPLAIQRITGLTDADLDGQPSFHAFQDELAEALRGWTVVAHNAFFERSFLAEVFASIDAEVIDSCELLHYLFPELDSHSLESAVKWAKVSDRCAHRALRDCEDTFAVVCHALGRCEDEARADELAEVLACLAPEADLRHPEAGVRQHPALVRLLMELYERCRHQSAPLTLTGDGPFLPPRPERLRQRGVTVSHDNDEGDVTVEPVTTADVDAVLGAGGALERTVDGFRPRVQQLQIARRVARALSAGERLAVEAGTGTGKSLAYLTPAALFAAKNGLKVAVAPNTRALQDQLMEKDLPRLHRALGGSFGYALLKGQTNYLCRRRTLELTRVEAGMPWEERAPRAYLRAYLRRSPDGDLDRTSYWFKEHYPALAGLLQGGRSEAATTLSDRCPYYRQCYYHSAVAHAEKADVLVINQALALSWPQRYPRLRHLILDEAHELEDVVTTALGSELSEAVLGRVGERLLGRPGRKGLLAELKRTLAGTGAGRAGADLLQQLEATVYAVGKGCLELGDAVYALCAAGGERGGRGFSEECRITVETRAGPQWQAIRAALLEVRQTLIELGRKLGPGVNAVLPTLGARNPSLERELAGATAEITETCERISEFADKPDPHSCYFASARPERRQWLLCAQPVDVRRPFEESLASNQRALVLTSATLSTGPGNPWILDRLGLTRPYPDTSPTEFLRSGTPFDLERQSLVVLVTDAPDPQEPAFVDWATDRIAGLAQFMGGRVLGLFASARRLEEVGDRVQERLEPVGIEVLRQSRGNSRNLAARQEQDHGSVLLGTKSFWQGIDIPGAGVACVFIDKLPLEPQNRPIVTAREERLGGDTWAGFMQYRLPRALLQLRQGVGRLIRSADDRGVVIIADPGSPTYRAQVFAALEGYRVEALPWARARVRLFEAIKAMGLHASAHRSRAPSPAAAPTRAVAR
ncbi:MAG: exonuclease [Myxococcaceae bacterium]|nr:exonuclease [Myxococcaceae bacterium]